MIIPTRGKLIACCPPGSFLFQGVHFHPEPRAYKYLCRVFSRESAREGWDFLASAPYFCLHDAMQRVAHLVETGEPCILYQTSIPRLAAPVPFSASSLRWQGVKFACAFADDPDPEWQGYK